jgi:FMN-dependent NADH-azoreductase
MNTILLLEASPHGGDSLGTRLVREAIGHLQARYPHVHTVSRSLGLSALPALSDDYARALVAMRPDTEPVFACSEQLIGELEQSDVLLISTPMHNFTVPAALKLWIDLVLRIGRTFRGTPEGKFGLLEDRPTLVLVRSGGICTGDAARQPDFLTPYLTQVLAVIGITSVEFIYLEGIAPGAEAIEAVRHKLAHSLILTPFIGEMA